MEQYVLSIMCVRLCSCVIYPAYKAHLSYAALYFHVWPAWMYRVLHIIS